MYWEAGAARFLIQDLITRRASNIRVRRRMHSVHRSLHRAAYSGAPMEKSCELDSGLRNAQGRTLSVSQNDLIVFFDFITRSFLVSRARPSSNISVKLRLMNWPKALLLDFSPIASNCWPTGAIADYKLEPVGHIDLSCMGMHGQHEYTCREPARASQEAAKKRLQHKFLTGPLPTTFPELL